MNMASKGIERSADRSVMSVSDPCSPPVLALHSCEWLDKCWPQNPEDVGFISNA